MVLKTPKKRRKKVPRPGNGVKAFKGKAGPGRPKGMPNKITTEIRELAQNLFNRKWWKSTERRMEAGEENPQLVMRLIEYGWGPPPSQPLVIEQTVKADPVPQVDNYTKSVEYLKYLTGAGLIPADLLAKFAIRGNGADDEGNGEFKQ
jgi:hypothetical protein